MLWGHSRMSWSLLEPWNGTTQVPGNEWKILKLISRSNVWKQDLKLYPSRVFTAWWDIPILHTYVVTAFSLWEGYTYFASINGISYRSRPTLKHCPCIHHSMLTLNCKAGAIVYFHNTNRICYHLFLSHSKGDNEFQSELLLVGMSIHLCVRWVITGAVFIPCTVPYLCNRWRRCLVTASFLPCNYIHL